METSKVVTSGPPPNISTMEKEVKQSKKIKLAKGTKNDFTWPFNNLTSQLLSIIVGCYLPEALGDFKAEKGPKQEEQKIHVV